MTTVQIVGIAVAAAVVLLLVIALVVTRRRDRLEPPPPGTSFLDLSPQDTLDALGRAEAPVEDVTLEPNAVRSLLDAAAARTPAAAAPRVVQAPVTDADDVTESLRPAAPAEIERPSPAPAPADRLSLDWGLEADVPDLAAGGGDGARRSPSDVLPKRPEAAGTPDEIALDWAAGPPDEARRAGDDAFVAPGPPARKVPLSDIIVTTSSKVIDLDDPEVRRMLTDLVKFEIDQATRYREQGQNLDAVLQLTEAEKISRALGLTDSAGAIHLMMRELQR